MRRRSDARTLESSALHLLRRQVVQAVRGGMSQTDAARIRSMIVGKVPDH
jgi:hypothetical protein